MSEHVGAEGQASAGVAGGDGAVAAGAALRQAREAAGLHIGALAVALKVPVSKLEALENGTLTQTSGPVFARALASSVCRTLKMDAAPVLQLLPAAAVAQLHQKGDLNEPFRGEGRGIQFAGSERMRSPLVLAVLALVLGAVALMLLPELKPFWGASKSVGEPVGDKVPDAVDGPATVTPAATPAAGSAAPSAAGMTVTAAISAAPALAASVPAKTATPLPAAAPPASGPAVIPVSPATSAGVLGFKASGPSWVEVTDAKGAVVFRKLLSAGESTQVDGTPPLRVVVGRADVTEVTVRGTRVDVMAQAKDNVARFEVSP